jgi:hypothetical protein
MGVWDSARISVSSRVHPVIAPSSPFRSPGDPKFSSRRVSALLRLGCTLLLGLGAPVSPAYVFTDRADGVSSSHFDVGLGIEWLHGTPRGLDADGQPDGPRAFGQVQLKAASPQRVIRIELTALVQAWWTARLPNDGLLLRQRAGSHLEFHSREEPDMGLRPQLLLVFDGGTKRYLEPVADAALDVTSVKGLGSARTLRMKGSAPLALRFQFGKVDGQAPPRSAELVLVRTAAPVTADARLEVLRLESATEPALPARRDGIAARYKGDLGISSDPDVLFADGFDNGRIDRRWTQGMATDHDVVQPDQLAPELSMPALAGPALRVTIPKKRQLGLDLRYKFKKHHGHEPDEIYFRYYLLLHPDWLQAPEGGKLPGLAGTYGLASWGGRPWDGYLGWSMRGSYDVVRNKGHPAQGKVVLGNYVYHSKSSKFGQGMVWPGASAAGLLTPGRWYCIEQRLRMNTPGKHDGLFEAWVDGAPVFSRKDLKWRDATDIHIEELWMNVFHGGPTAAPSDMNALMDGVVLARRYIGPMGP